MSLIAAIDAGTSSVRVILFDKKGTEVAKHQTGLTLFAPHPGWVEQDPVEIITALDHCFSEILANHQHLSKEDIIAIGISNQRETTILWDSVTSKPLHHAIVWEDIRTSTLVKKLIKKYGSKDHIRSRCGLPFSTYFSATKIRWLYDHIPEIAQKAAERRCKFGTVDAWIVWNLLGKHLIDVTNASRTMLMNLETLEWDPSLLELFGIDREILPDIVPSSHEYGTITNGSFAGLRLRACIGDQQAALLGQLCFEEGQANQSYGTSAVMLYNTGEKPVASEHGLLTTVAYQLEKEAKPVYAIEGSIASAGSSITFLLDNLQLVSTPSEVDTLAAKLTCVSSDANALEELPEPWNLTGGVYFVPAFSGLFAPYWRDDARALLFGITMNTKREHICRAVLEGIGHRIAEVAEAMQQDVASLDNPTSLRSITVNGGLARSDTLLQIQSDLLQMEIQRSSIIESTSMGAAILAGLGVGLWKDLSEVRELIQIQTVPFRPQISAEDAHRMKAGWKDAVARCFPMKPVDNESRPT